MLLASRWPIYLETWSRNKVYHVHQLCSTIFNTFTIPINTAGGGGDDIKHINFVNSSCCVFKIFKTTLNGQSNTTVSYLVATCFSLEIVHHQARYTGIKKRFLYTSLFTFRNSGSDRYNCINSRQNSVFAVYVTFWQEDANGMRTSDELVTCTTARKHVHTRFRLLRILVENRKTVAQTVKPHHTRTNSLRSSLCCASCLVVYGALKTETEGRLSKAL
jgi:hypothetical protein